MTVNNDWYRLAKMDWETARYIFNNMNPKPLEITCYLAHQSAEKLLKGFLVENGREPPKTHNLMSLNDLCVAIEPMFEGLDNALADLNPYSVQPRYPQEIEITQTDAVQALKCLDTIMNFFKRGNP